METQEAEEGPTYQPLRGPGGAAGCLPDTKTVARMMATLEQSGNAKRLMITLPTSNASYGTVKQVRVRGEV